ncbi:MAG: DUF2156 domain-containing protein [Candidatus Omnitrophica bacterium]|nr:DUF2156 domain-containing protein [Candidatus Omnitrophota bacterium]
MPIPIYPEFKPLAIEHGQEISTALTRYPVSISELTFTNLYAWRQAYQFSLSSLHEAIIIAAIVNGRRQFLCPFGSSDVKAVIVKIMTDSDGMFIRLPEEVKKMFEFDDRFAIAEDRNNADYVYRTADLIALSGSRFDGKRNLIKKFKSQHTYSYVNINAMNIERCFAFEQEWCSVKDCDAVKSLSDERNAIREMVRHFSDFGLLGAAISIEDRICALALAEALNQETLVMHVLKADPSLAGLYQTMMQEFLAREASKFLYVNLEQDLGVEGLRKAKLSYHPLKLINKYTLRKVT